MKVAIANRLSAGDEITLAVEGRTVTLTVAGRLKVGRDAISLYGEQSPMAFVPLSTALDLAGAPGQVDRVEVVLRPSVDVNRAKADLAQQVGSDAFTLFYRCPQPRSTPFAGRLERAGSRAGRGHDRRR